MFREIFTRCGSAVKRMLFEERGDVASAAVASGIWDL